MPGNMSAVMATSRVCSSWSRSRVSAASTSLIAAIWSNCWSGEVDGVSYHFVSEQQFQEKAESGELLEHAIVHGTHSYGTPRGEVADAIASGRDVLLEIDLQGARQVKRNLPEAKLVFIAPPSWEELVRRLTGRGTENASQVEHRLATARVELEAREEADFVIVNDRIEDTAQALIALIGL